MPKYPEITSTKIKYNSPSGWVYIGKYIPPFEKVKKGFGFKGVIVEDLKSGKLQCHICGEWFEQMPLHLKAKHNVSCSDYKKKFGLLQSTALKSKKMRLKQSKVMQGMRVSHPKYRSHFKKNNAYAGNRKGTKRAVECKNKYGVCDLQVMQKVIELHNELGKTPTLTDLKDRYGVGFIFQIYKKYSSYIKYCYEIGLEAGYSNFNPKYSKEYFIEKALSNEPSTRIFTKNELRALYKYFTSITDLREVVIQITVGKR
jgi:hypothetical protein